MQFGNWTRILQTVNLPSEVVYHESHILDKPSQFLLMRGATFHNDMMIFTDDMICDFVAIADYTDMDLACCYHLNH